MITLYGMRMSLDDAQRYVCHGLNGNIEFACREALEQLRALASAYQREALHVA